MSPDDIDKLTVGEVRAIVDRAADALKTLRELGFMSAPPKVANAYAALTSPLPNPDSPFPCAGCGREKPQGPREAVQARACDVCGNNLPARDGAVSIAPGVTNKPAIVRNGNVAAVVSTLSPEERAAKLALPAFGPDGLPLEADA